MHTVLEVTSVCLRYLESEWEVRRGSSRGFGADEMQSSHCKVPLQDNSSDCGLYLLHYVESFLKVKYLTCHSKGAPLNLLSTEILHFCQGSKHKVKSPNKMFK